MDDPAEVVLRALRFGLRFRAIYQWVVGMRHVIPFWRDNLGGENGLGEDFWRNLFLEGLRPGVYQLLTERDPPSIWDLLDIGWVEENGLGVYCKIALCEDGSSDDVIYVGMAAATQCNNWGLTGRRYGHQSDWNNHGTQGSLFHKYTVKNRKQYSLHFVALWTHEGVTELDDLDGETAYLAKVGSNFSEFILSKWLSAYTDVSVLYGPARVWETVPYKGSLKNNCIKEQWMMEGDKIGWQDIRESNRRYNLGLHLEGVTEEARADWVEKRLAKNRARNRKYKKKTVAEMTTEERQALKEYRNAGRARRCDNDPAYKAKLTADATASRERRRAEGTYVAYPNGRRDRTKDTIRQKERRREQKLAGKDMTHINKKQREGRARRKREKEAAELLAEDSDF